MTVCNSSEGLRFISSTRGVLKVLKYHIRIVGRINVGKLHFCNDFMLNFLFFLLSQCCVKASVGFRHKKHWKTRFHIQKRLVNRCEICTDPRQISSRFTFRNVETQTRARVAGLAASSPVTSDLNTVQPSLFTPTQSQTYSAFSSTIQNLLSRFTWSFDGNMMNVWQFNNWIIARYWSYLKYSNWRLFYACIIPSKGNNQLEKSFIHMFCVECGWAILTAARWRLRT